MWELSLLLLGVAALIGRVGVCLYLTGLSRAKNAAGSLMRALADLCVAVLAFWAAGHAVMSGGFHSLLDLDHSFAAQAFFIATAVLVATAAALGGTLERTRLLVPLAASAVLAGLVAPLAMRWAWSGWLYHMGFIDIGGASFLHVCGGLFAGAGAFMAKPRAAKYNRDGSANLIPGHSFPLTATGTLLIALGLLPQIVGCSILREFPPAAAAANVLLAAAAGGLAAMILGRIRYASTDVHLALVGLLAGAVSMSAAAGRLSTPAAVLIGAAGGLLTAQASVWIELRRKIDDPGCGIAIHAVGGAWALLAGGVAIADSPSRLHQLAIQALGAAAISAMALIAAVAIFLAMQLTVGLRLSDADELDGSDLVEHDVNSYPDFQQTMIKSYHLRET